MSLTVLFLVSLEHLNFLDVVRDFFMFFIVWTIKNDFINTKKVMLG